MQTAAYILVLGEKILVLVRDNKYSRSLKLRKTGKEGRCFVDEGIYLMAHPELVEKLKKGEVISL